MDLISACAGEEKSREIAARDIDIELRDLNEYFDNAIVLGKLDPVIGNCETRCTALLTFALARKSVIIRGEAGTGKTKIMNAMVSLIWGDQTYYGQEKDVFVINETAERGLLTYDIAKQVENSKYCFIPEIQNVKSLTPMVKLWAEGKPQRYQRQDRRGGTETIVLPPRPILTSLAEGNEVMKGLGAEMSRRFMNLWTTTSMEQNERIQYRKAQMRLLPESELLTMDKEKMLMLRAHIRNVQSLNLVLVVNPCIVEMAKAIPKKYVVSNSYTDYFFDTIDAVTRFYYPKNLIIDNRLFSSPRDNKLSWILIGPQLVDSCLAIPYGIGREILKLLPSRGEYGSIRTDMSDTGLDVQDIADLLDNEGRAIELPALEEILRKLVLSNFAKTDKKSKKYYKTQEVDAAISGVDWPALVSSATRFMVDNYPEWANSYYESYCAPAVLKYIHPFTGEVLDLITDKPVKTDEENKKVAALSAATGLPESIVDRCIVYYNLKISIPRLFFINDMVKEFGMVDAASIGRVYDVLKTEELKR
jgi:hypothetical protein